MSLLGPGGSRSGLGGAPIGAIGGLSLQENVGTTPQIVTDSPASFASNMIVDATAGTITVSIGGTYSVYLSSSLRTTVNGISVEARVFVNGVVVFPLEIGFSVQMATPSIFDSAGGNGPLTLLAGDVVTVQVSRLTAGTTDIIFNKFVLMLVSEDAVIAPQIIHDTALGILGNGTWHLSETEQEFVEDIVAAGGWVELPFTPFIDYSGADDLSVDYDTDGQLGTARLTGDGVDIYGTLKFRPIFTTTTGFFQIKGLPYTKGGHTGSRYYGNIGGFNANTGLPAAALQVAPRLTSGTTMNLATLGNGVTEDLLDIVDVPALGVGVYHNMYFDIHYIRA